MVLMLFFFNFVGCMLKMLYFSFFKLPFCSILVGNFLRIQVVQRDYLNPSLGSSTGLFLGIQISREMGLCYLSSPGVSCILFSESI